MDLMRAFSVMLSGITAADASDRQVNGILRWRELVHEAVKRSPGGTNRAEGTSVGVVASETHLGWRIASGYLIKALRKQENTADLDYAHAIATAEMAESEAASAQAAAAEAMLAAEACAATVIGIAAAAACVAEAGAQAAAASAALARAAEAREFAEASMAWGIAAKEARTFGTRLLADENAIAFPVGEALRAAGGPAEVYGDRHALTMDGCRPLAMRGGPR
jgi:hypothetical protein